MTRELTLEELRGFTPLNSSDIDIMKKNIESMSSGDVIAKLKVTSAGSYIVFYVYDKKLFRRLISDKVQIK